ncbi:hypothetical protein [Alcanivorax jadensis]|uniref:hypothetical protein n=1 Tax=Alcanivorax jadensis TaxID=64988 RepID=UPI0035627EE8
MRTQRLGFVGLGDDTVSACLSMLKIIDGRSSVHWDQSVPGEADVLMVACDQQEQTHQADLSNKPCIVVYPTTRDRPASTFTLPHPFRVMQLLDVLDEVVRTLTTDGDPDHTGATPVELAKPGSEADFCASLYRVITTKTEQRSELYCSNSEEGQLLVKPASHRFYARPALLHALNAGTVTLSQLAPYTDPVPEGMAARPLFELAWLTGANHSDGLLPWLEPDSQFQLSRWPSAAALNKSRPLLSLCALMTRRALGLAQLQTLSKCDKQTLYHFLNACEISGLLVSERRTTATQPTPVPVESQRFGGLIRGLRTRLGLS